MFPVRLSLFSIILLFSGLSAAGQINLQGLVLDAKLKTGIAHVNISVKKHGKTTVSSEQGGFRLQLPATAGHDTLVFSRIGYNRREIPVKDLAPATTEVIELVQKTTELTPLVIRKRRLVTRKFGVKSEFAVMHFVDGSVNRTQPFEIAQRIRLNNAPAQITTVNLLINQARQDSALFRINFYTVADSRPAKKIMFPEILQKKAIPKGWLTFDLSDHQIFLKGDFIVGIEFLSPQPKEAIPYEVKLGGSAKSYVRNAPDSAWKTPPHHYKLHVTALIDPEKYKERYADEDLESPPTALLFSDNVNDHFSIFIKTPPGYSKNSRKKYPVTYLLDANAYFDILAHQIPPLKDRILVGIGYENAYLMDSLRNRDYTYPIAEKQDSFAVSGGGEKFLRFLTRELIPYVDNLYRTDSRNRTLMGHSLGGYFTLFAFQRLAEAPAPFFNHFIAASPSLYYGNEYLRKSLSDAHLHPGNKGRLLISFGENEFRDDSTLQPIFDSYLHRLRLIPGAKLTTKIYPGFGHMDTAVASFEKGF